jgi:Predicted transcriptional regulators
MNRPSLVLDPKKDLPLYAQLARQLREAVVSGQWDANQPLPSVRSLVALLRINPQTVLRAYRALEEEGLIERRQGQGTFVRGEALQAAAAARRQEVLHDLAHLAARARELGLSQEQIEKAVHVHHGKESS